MESFKNYFDFYKLWEDIQKDFESLKGEYTSDDYDGEYHPEDFNFKDFIYFMTEIYKGLDLDLDECEINDSKVHLVFTVIIEQANESDNTCHGCSYQIIYDFSEEQITHFSDEGF